MYHPEDSLKKLLKIMYQQEEKCVHWEKSPKNKGDKHRNGHMDCKSY